MGGAGGDALLGALRPGGRLVPVAYGSYSAERAAELGVTVGEVPFETIDTRDLERLGCLFDDGRLRVALDSVVPLRDARMAFERSESRRARGKIVISMGDH